MSLSVLEVEELIMSMVCEGECDRQEAEMEAGEGWRHAV